MQRDAYEKYCKEVAAKANVCAKGAEQLQKEIEKGGGRQWEEIKKFHAQGKKQERAQKQALKDTAKLQKVAEAAACRAEKAALADSWHGA